MSGSTIGDQPTTDGSEKVDVGRTLQEREESIASALTELSIGDWQSTLDWSMDDLRRGIVFHQDTITRLPDPVPGVADNGFIYAAIYDKRDFLFDMNSTVLRFSHALVSGPLPDEERAKTLFDLGRILAWRFEITGHIQDLSLAVEMFEISVYKPQEVDSCEVHNYLSGALAARYLYRKAVDDKEAAEDINRAIELGKVATTAAKGCKNHQETDQHGQDTSRYFLGLGRLFVMRFDALNGVDDLDQAIQSYQEALKFQPPDYRPTVAKIQDRLGNASFKRLQYACAQPDVATTNWETHWKTAVDNLIRAVGIDTIPPKPTTTSEMFIVNLAKALMYTPPESVGPLPDVRSGISNVDLGITLLQQLARDEKADPSLRADAAMRWARFEHYRGRFEEALKGYSIAIDLVPLIGWNGLAGHTRVGSAKRFRRLSSDVTSCAIQLNDQKYLEEAIEISEYVRSLFWRALSRFRSDTAELRETEPTLADRLSSLAEKLEKPSLKRQLSGIVVSGDKLNIEPSADLKQLQEEDEEYRQLIKEWDSCVQDVRKVEGFEDFLKRRRFSVLRKAASDGPVVLFIIGSFASDALIVRAEGPVERVRLPNIKKDEVAKMVGHLSTEIRRKQKVDRVLRDHILGPLWDKVCKPVLDVLEPKSPEEHVWWCPTGNLSFLPIHAAGKYNQRRKLNTPIGRDVVPNRVISSYTGSLGQLLDSRSRALSRSESQSQVPRLLFVGKNEPPLYDEQFKSLPLDAVLKEKEALESLFKELTEKSASNSSPLPLHLEKPLMNTDSTVGTVLPELNNFVHFSCHGKQGRVNPILSGLLLDDERLTLLAILNHWTDQSRQSQSNHNLEFAFLSACETATGSDLLPDQALHLAAGMQFIGSLRVVATMWTIQDTFTVSVSRHFYDELIRLRMTDVEKKGQWNVGKALHEALEKAIAKDPSNLWGWVPYIHMGV